jgi:hypothetical protein
MFIFFEAMLWLQSNAKLEHDFAGGTFSVLDISQSPN